MRDPLAIRLTKYVPHKPHPRQHAFLLLNQTEALFGGAVGGGKSDALLMAALQYVDIPGYAAILFRKSYQDLSKPGALLFRSKEWLMNTDARWRENDRTWTFPSGASLTFGYLDHPDDKFNYQSAEVQYCGFDELTQFLELDYRYLFSRLRKPPVCEVHQDDPGTIVNSQFQCSECGTPAPPLAGVPLRMRSASNPGGAGHDWVEARFIKKERSEWDDETGADPAQRIFIPSKLRDNPSIHEAAYLRTLAHLDPHTRRQLLEGDWNAREANACFSEFNWEEHTVPGSRHPDSPYEVYKFLDFGLHHMPILWAEVQRNRMFIFAELDCQGQDLPAACDAINTIDEEFGTQGCPTIIDPAGLGTNYQTGKSDADVLQEHGIVVLNLDNTDRYSRESRTSQIKFLLRTNRLFISRDCKYLIKSLQRSVWDRIGGSGARKDCYKKDGLWEHCLAEGTLVSTANGDVPIESVCVGERVLTRQGWCPVVASGLTSSSKETLRVECDDGSTLVGTANHRVWTEQRGFVRLDAVREGDIMLLCRMSKSSSLTATLTDATPITRNGRCVSTIADDEMVSVRQSTYIEPFGSRYTVPCHRDTMSTTSTKIPTTMIPTILSASRQRSTLRHIGHQSVLKQCESTQLALGLSPKNGMPLRKDWLGIESMASSVGTGGSQFKRQSRARTVATGSPRCTLRERTIAVESAQMQRDTYASGRKRSCESALPVASRILPTEQCPLTECEFAAVRVVSVCADSARPVYDLTVAGAHEFFANGLLVHNCLDALGEGTIRVFPPQPAQALETEIVASASSAVGGYSDSEFG